MSKTVITIEHLACGQPHPYADSKYHARIKGERHGVYTSDKIVPAYLTRYMVEQLARAFVHNWASKPEWHQSRLKTMRPINPRETNNEEQSGEWEVLIIQPFLD